ncbi:ABC transporter permease [Siccirubricoccus sp. KC 17139]|uniref:ABC transporter permease n=1 Tax=Siccirubricoccus soli TaxID=2899147 RepID=A0ABT1D815_9PROT|nr:ABC transporter permease [Siccirubricoccus soli]MCO6417314.1 ABC transporter permease [Siccirubricoccus soli]MCP2683449.1 ABC transporter permease [Siccirubricoccus soli]
MSAEWRKRLSTGGMRCVAILLFLAIWFIVSIGNAHWWKFFNPVLLPTPTEVVKAGIEAWQSGELQDNILASMARVIQGFAIAAIAGVAVGLAVGTWRPLERLVEPMIELLRPIPPLAFLPMMVLWFGIGEMSKIAFIAYAAFFPVFTTTVEGIKYVDPVLLRAASSLGASRADLFRHVVLPAATPSIITGLRLGFGLSFFVIVAAEFIAADSGLGYMINDARTFFMVSQMLLGAVVIGLIGFGVNILLRSLEGWLLRWRVATRG